MKVAITGALSYSGRYLSKTLLSSSPVTSILNLSRRSTPFVDCHVLKDSDLSRITTSPLNFDSHASMVETLTGVDVLFCTYWIRFEKDGDTHFKASERVRGLFNAAEEAGVKKVVFSSHTRTSLDSPFTYIAGKARAEENLRVTSNDSKKGMNYSIVRPCGIFGDTPTESILMNNAAYVLRRSPLFLLAGNGSAVFQPVHVRDMAEVMRDLGMSLNTTGEEVDACGPDKPTARELFGRINKAVGGWGFVTPSYLPTWVVCGLTKPLNWYTGDVLLDVDDLDLLNSGLTRANKGGDERIKGRRSLFEWLEERGGELGREYVNSVERYYEKKK